MATATATATKVKFRPLGDRIVCRRVEAEEKTAGGIVLPDKAKEKPKEGVVVAVGPGKMLENGSRAEVQVNVKDRVLFGAYAGTEVKYQGEEYVILGESEVLAVIEG